MASSFDFSRLYGRSLAAIFEDLEGRSDWDRATPRPDGSVSLWRRAEAMVVAAGDVSPPEPPNSEAFMALMRALEAGEHRVEADGDHTNGYEPVVIPAGFWRQRRDDRYWQLSRDRESARLEVLVRPKEHIPVHDNPRLVAPVAPTTPGDTFEAKPARGYDRHADVARGVALARSGLKYTRAAAALFEELYPKPAERELWKSWDLERGRYVRRMRTKISKADKGKPSS